MKDVTITPKDQFERSQTSQILVERRNGNDIVIVTLNRPEAGNVIDRNMHRELEDIGHQLILR